MEGEKGVGGRDGGEVGKGKRKWRSGRFNVGARNSRPRGILDPATCAAPVAITSREKKKQMTEEDKDAGKKKWS